MYGAIATYLLFELLVGERNSRRRILRELGGQDHATSMKALQEATDEGMLRDGTLRGVKIKRADLSGGDFHRAVLVEADFFRCNLNGTRFQSADLTSASLSTCQLEGTNFWEAKMTKARVRFSHAMEARFQGVHAIEANFSETDFRHANFQGAALLRVNFHKSDLRDTSFARANLAGANLTEARLAGAILDNVVFTKETVLPDAKLVKVKNGVHIYDQYWNPQVDMRRYTDPNHPDFWQPDASEAEPEASEAR
jgi:uncharacterized protein YjbI with pentapeptide repeats